MAYIAYPSILAACSEDTGEGHWAQTDISTAGNTVLFEKIIILQLIEKYPFPRNPKVIYHVKTHFYTGSYPQLEESILNSQTIFYKD